MAPRVLIKGFLLLSGLALLGFWFHGSDWGGSLNESWIDARVRENGIQGVFLFLLVGGFFTALALPRQIIAFLAGYAFGVGFGTLYGALAALLGCVLTFGYARMLGRGLIQNRLRGRAERLSRFVLDHPFAMTLLLRLLPVGSNFLLNLAAGVSRVRAAPFFAGSFIGYLPQTLVFALVGSGVRVDPSVNFAIALVLFLLSAAIGIGLYRRFTQVAEVVGSTKEGPGRRTP